MESLGWIKLHRSLLASGSTFQSLTAVQQIIAVHIILRANYRPMTWQDAHTGLELSVQRGQLLCSRAQILAWFPHDTDVSEQKVRTALKKFDKLNFITQMTTSHYTLLTVVNYEVYQSKDSEDASHPNDSRFFQKSNQAFNQGSNQAKALSLFDVTTSTHQAINQPTNPDLTSTLTTSKEIQEENKLLPGGNTLAAAGAAAEGKPAKAKKSYHPESHPVVKKFHARIGLQGVNTQRYFADVTVADRLLKAYQMTGTELESAIAWLLNDRFIGPAISKFKAIEDHFTLWLNRDNPQVKQRQKNAQPISKLGSSALPGNQIVPAEKRKGGIIEL